VTAIQRVTSTYIKESDKTSWGGDKYHRRPIWGERKRKFEMWLRAHNIVLGAITIIKTEWGAGTKDPKHKTLKSVINGTRRGGEK